MYQKKFVEDIAGTVVDKGKHNPEYLEREMIKWKEDFSREHGSVPNIKDIDFFVTNVEFTRNESTSSWRIREARQSKFFPCCFSSFWK